MKPTPVLCARLRFTTKEVGKGFYRGNRTGSMGAHTEYGGYVIDWRKVRHYNMPDLRDFKLTPFVTKEMEPKSRLITPDDGEAYTPKYLDALDWLRTWKMQNPQEYEDVVQHQEAEREKKVQQQRLEELDRQYYEEQRAQEEHRSAMAENPARKTTISMMDLEEQDPVVINANEEAPNQHAPQRYDLSP